MYTPPAHKIDRLDVLHQMIGDAGLATLITLGTNGIEATPVPVLLDPSEGEFGTIYGHLSRANPQWQGVDPAVPALMTFSGPDAYISPSWYATKAATQKVVPTWNYLAVHAYGKIEFFEDRDRLLALVTRLTDKHEAGRAEPWAVTDAPADYIAAQLKGIVGFRLEISRLDGKSKMSQNKSAGDHAGVIEGLKKEGTEEVAVADVMSGKMERA